MTAPRTCDELAVCQDKSPRCSKCKPSEGSITVQNLLREFGKRPLLPLVPELKK